MKKYCLLILLALLVYSCGESDAKFLKPKKVENLVEIKNGVYTEWYPGKKNIKFQGPQDNNHLRNGKWVFFSEGGEELSITFYENGKREGFTIVKYPNGRLHYRGEYQDDKIPKWVLELDDLLYNVVDKNHYTRIQWLNDYPELKNYGLSTNYGYGTKQHINAIKETGYTKYHRKSFKIKSLQKEQKEQKNTCSVRSVQ